MAMMNKVKSFSAQCVRVFHLLRKPDLDELKKVSLVAALGLGAIGLIGFLVAILMGFVFPS